MRTSFKTSLNVAQIQTQIKSILKAQGLNYQDLGKKIGLSESGVKKIMRGKDFSMLRLDQICKALNLSLFDFIQTMDQTEFENTEFQPEQQKALLKKPELLYLYWKLAFERCPLPTAAQELGFSKEMIQQLLFSLDKLKLIEWGPGDKIKLPRLRAIRSFGDGELIRTVYREWSHELIDRITSSALNQNKQQGLFIFRGVPMRKETLQALISALREIEEEFVNRAIREMKIYPYKELTPVSWISALVPQSFVKIRQRKS
jgi:transcriptional regulator with XRE-family HTH domain